MKPGDINLGNPNVMVEQKGPPHAYLEALRKEAPVHWNPPAAGYRVKAGGGLAIGNDLSKGFWVLSKHADVSAASRNPKVFSSHAGGPVIWDLTEEQLQQHRQGMMVVRDVERHFAAIDGLLADGRDYLVGKQLTLADIAVISQVKALLYAEEVVAIVRHLPRVAAWIGRVDAEAPDRKTGESGTA